MPPLGHRLDLLSFNEAGAFMPRKGGNRLQVRQPLHASMRPGLLCPGRLASVDAESWNHPCFNEAGAFMPRKAGVSPSQRRRGAGFNEAGAFMPRKARFLARNNRPRRAASMRPGLLCPGRPPALPPRRRWRLGFNEAGAFMPRKAHTGHQCHGWTLGFNEAGAFMPRKASPASPRPSGQRWLQ